MKTTLKILTSTLGVCLAAVSTAACGGDQKEAESPDAFENEGPMEEAGEEIDETASDASEAVENAADETEDAFDGTQDEVE